MNPSDFKDNARVFHLIEEMKSSGFAAGAKNYSDIIDDSGNQYVDLVMEGGGVWGIALVGYVYAMEELGIRFLQLGGASAGSINALLMAAAGPIDSKKTDWILEKISNKNFNDFVDGDEDAKDFINAYLKGGKKIKMLWKGAQIIDNITEDYGLNKGDNFLNWLKDILAEKNIHTTKDIENLRCITPAGLKYWITNEPLESKSFSKIAIVASDITTETKVVFPEMANLYWSNKDEINPAHYVRASMSIPVFFHPYVVKDIPQGPAALTNWRDVYPGELPDKVYFVDGGVLSNFPIDLFHNNNRVPKAPTFGVKLEIDRMKYISIDSIGSFVGAIFGAARHVHDYDFLMRNPDYKRLISYIEVGNVSWIDFALKDEDKIDLFYSGVKAACDFLIKYDWDAYKKLRAAKAEYSAKVSDIDS